MFLENQQIHEYFTKRIDSKSLIDIHDELFRLTTQLNARISGTWFKAKQNESNTFPVTTKKKKKKETKQTEL